MSKVRLTAALTAALLMWVALAAWAFSSPVGASPDDDYHVAMLYCVAGEAECTVTGERTFPCFAWSASAPADCSQSRSESEILASQGTWATGPQGELTTPPTAGIDTEWYPPLYYQTMSLLVGESLAETTIAVRLVNVSLAVGLIVLSVALSLPTLRRPVALAWLVGVVPLGMFFLSSINPSAWTILGIVAMWGPMASFLLAESTSRGRLISQLVFIQLAVLMALGSRTEPPIYLSIVALGLSPLALRWPLRSMTGRNWWTLLLPAAVIVESLIARALHAEDRLARRPGTDMPDQGLWDWITSGLAPALANYADPALGWLDTLMPTLVVALAAGAYLGSILMGLREVDARKLVPLTALTAGAVAMLMYLQAMIPYPGRYQPRYFLPLMIVILGLALLPKLGRGQRATFPLVGLQVAALAVMVAGANSVALQVNTARYVLGLGSDSNPSPEQIRQTGRPDWWWNSLPFTPWQSWVIGSVAFAAAALLLAWWLAGKPTQTGGNDHTAGMPH